MLTKFVRNLAKFHSKCVWRNFAFNVNSVIAGRGQNFAVTICTDSTIVTKFFVEKFLSIFLVFLNIYERNLKCAAKNIPLK